MAPRQRLLHVLDGDFASGYFPDLARFADGERYDVIFTSLQPLALERAATLELPGVSRYEALPGAPLPGEAARVRRVARSARALRQLLARLRPDVVHAHLYEPALVGMLAAAAQRVPVRVAGRHHSDLVHRAGGRLHVGVDRLTTRLGDAVIVNSEFTRQVMIKREGADPDKVRVVYYGLDIDALDRAGTADLDALRGELGLAPDDLVVLVPARLDREKGHEHLFAALAALEPGLRERVTVLLAGDGPDRDRFAADLAARGLEQRVRFLGHRSDMPQLYRLADLTVLPSLSEAFGQVLIESLFFGTAVLATRVGGIPEIVEHERTGLLVEPADPRGLAAALSASFGDPAARQRYAAAGSRRVREVFDSRRTAADNEAIYEELLGRTRRGR